MWTSPINKKSHVHSIFSSLSSIINTRYRSLASAFQYLPFTRTDISYVVQHVCLHIHDLKLEHMNTLKRIMAFCDTCKIPCISAYICTLHPFLVLLHILMLIGVDVLTQGALPLVTAFSFVTTYPLSL